MKMDSLYLEDQPNNILFQILDGLTLDEIHNLMITSKTLKLRILKNYFNLKLSNEEVDRNTVEKVFLENNNVGFQFLLKFYLKTVTDAFDFDFFAKISSL